MTPHELYDLFPGDAGTEIEVVAPEQIPEPYRSLLVHTHHMTVTVEGFYGQSVAVRVLKTDRAGERYRRQILLSLHESGEVVQFGVIEVHLAVLAPAVRDEIVAGRTPLGRVLIQNNVLRSIQPSAFVRVTPGPELCQSFGMASPEICYGRSGTITAGETPAIEVLEILAPVPKPALLGC